MKSTGSPGARRIPRPFAKNVHQIVLTPRARQQLHDAPPTLQGYVTGITAVLRVDPTTASAAIQIRQAGDGTWTATFAEGRGFLTYRVIQYQQAVVLLDWTWAG